MFAFAIWDAPRRRLLLARDRLGIKPLYWTLSGGRRLLFASEIKAILASGLVRAEANDRLPELLSTRYLSGDRDALPGIHRLMPGHTLVFEDGESRIRQYWDVPPAGGGRPGAASEQDTVARFRELLDESVRSA
jgi:asparagine synthase (glutamine-hydrolysing)